MDWLALHKASEALAARAHAARREGNDEEFQRLIQQILTAQPDNLTALIELSRVAVRSPAGTRSPAGVRTRAGVRSPAGARTRAGVHGRARIIESHRREE